MTVQIKVVPKPTLQMKTVLGLKGDTGPMGPMGPQGPQGIPGLNGGADGWSPVMATVQDGTRYVLQVTDWTGGTSAKPSTGYVGPSGLVANIANAVDIRGAQGPQGIQGIQGIQGPTGATGPQGPQGPAATIGTNSIDNTELAQMPANTLKGNNTGSTANAADLTVSQAQSLLAISHVLVETGTVSAAAQKDIAIPSGYQKVIIELDGVVPATSGAQLLLRVSLDNGSTFKNGATDYKYALTGYVESNASNSAASTGANSVLVTGAMGTTSNAAQATLTIPNPTGSSAPKPIRVASEFLTSTTTWATLYGVGIYSAANSAITNIRLIMSTGNIASLNYRVIGVR